MRRRDFLGVLSSAVAWPVVARAQQQGRVYRLGSLHTGPRTAPNQLAFYEALREQSFIEGQNLTVDERGYGLRADQIREHALELATAQVDVIVCAGDPVMKIAPEATKSIPIVGNGLDLVGSGVVRSLAKPGGNATGVSFFGTELDGKRLEILMQAMPTARHIAALSDTNMSSPQHLQMLQDLARSRGVELSIHAVTKAEEIAGAVDSVKRGGAEALNVLASPLLFVNRRIILLHVEALHLPAVYEWGEVADEGGLLAYGPRLTKIYRDFMARLVVEVLRGAKPEDLPVEQPTQFELVINLKTAKALGLEIPPSLLARADEVIE
jgi:putative tryptophan/tyrosine transport system substrate-binding protein